MNKSFFSVGWLAAATLVAVTPGIASGQTSAPIHAPAAAPARAPITKAPAPPAPAPAPPSAAPTKIAVPADVLTLPAAQIITVNGKQTTAGAIRQDIQSQILKQAGAPTLVKVASAKKAPPSHGASILRPASTRVVTSAPNLDCTNRPPTIMEISGSLSPGQEITLSGACFGEQAGQVKLTGPFPGGVLQLTFAHWSNGQIVAAVPQVRGVLDQTVAISVVSAAKAESITKPVGFVATRERVEVPARAWSPNAHFEQVWQATSNKPTKDETSPTQFNVTVNAACYLDTMDATATVGATRGVTGWADGPPNAATVQVAWVPQSTITTYYYGVTASSDVYLSVKLDVKAWASCPLGIAP